jgi:Protein of unknown function (DUF2510)
VSDMPPPSLPAGWYSDPKDESQDRFWDGKVWTEKTHAKFGTAPAPGARPAPAVRRTPVKAAGRPGPFAIGCLVIVGLIVVGIVIAVIVGNSSGGSSGGNGSADAITEAQSVLANQYGDSHSYSEVKTVTDAALSATDEPLTNTERSKAWSAVLAVADDPKVGTDPWEVMNCVASGDAGAGLTFPQLAATCAVADK